METGSTDRTSSRRRLVDCQDPGSRRVGFVLTNANLPHDPADLCAEKAKANGNCCKATFIEVIQMLSALCYPGQEQGSAAPGTPIGVVANHWRWLILDEHVIFPDRCRVQA